MSVNKKIILVTGHAGFIGSSLVERLLKDGYGVVGIDNFNDYYDPKIKEDNVKDFLDNQNFKQYGLDILDNKKLKKVFKDNKIDSIVHLAARAGVRPSLLNPDLYEQVNVNGTNNLLRLSEEFGVKQFVLASSSSVYGNQEKIPFSESDLLNKPVSPYAETKMAAEKLCKEFAKKTKIMTTILRFFTVYGPKGRPDMAPYLFTGKVLKGEKIIKFGDGSSSRDYTYIDDIVDGIVKAIQSPLKFEIINLGNNEPVSLNEFIALVEKLVGKKAIIINKPRHPADVKRTFADIQKAKTLLGWEPKTQLSEGLKKLIEWL
ncbi:MAG: GDP-mannose 4,6-dehydratase [Candidatus Beckwithbacteria bacterium]